jgi:hypothetical protein
MIKGAGCTRKECFPRVSQDPERLRGEIDEAKELSVTLASSCIRHLSADERALHQRPRTTGLTKVEWAVLGQNFPANRANCNLECALGCAPQAVFRSSPDKGSEDGSPINLTVIG